MYCLKFSDSAEITGSYSPTYLGNIGSDIAVIVKTPDEIQEVQNHGAFPDLPEERLFYTLFNDPLDQKLLEQLHFDHEQLQITEYATYLFVPDYSRSKLNNNFLERKLGIPMTTHNRNTLNKLIELATEQKR